MLRVEFSDGRPAAHFDGDAYGFNVNTNGTLVITSNETIIAHFTSGAWACVMNAPTEFFYYPTRNGNVANTITFQQKTAE